ncbi:MAG: hypothetical protein COU63_00745 [Candidatus Pacebacteria bacterium CG10_big_fil_rev_8_21_14_0_10_36_11]|nr:hypothetical protein [Candidatus Pacearchaeota archaeon]OIP74550.1 MAG: hypothetical protein AUK08_00345 [Candidatus Pacebacteria bacterium CG2_30_36_39]PIR65175.1 MAG: hypothetical protein COU63_00745 [Candidatus Pacebacteria bacterium CG10_big_fil_rev_8_21_14_0_10_36_11]PJC43155.1 MAG: hypothetical protein CO040_00665 [Candidatus Pacebacteria bacterium CG_4_9_14_0_2_um_filter_36_8]
MNKLIPWGILAVSFFVSLAAFSEKQKTSIKERDNNSCQFPGEHECGGGLLIHQIIPPKYAKKFGINPDFAANGITICQNALTGSQGIYPDIAMATTSNEPGALKKAITLRTTKLNQRQPYWNEKYDRAMHAIVARNTQTAEKTGWNFPLKKTRKSKKSTQ